MGCRAEEALLIWLPGPVRPGPGLQSTNGINKSNWLIGDTWTQVWVRRSSDRNYVDVGFDWDGNWIDRWEYYWKYQKGEFCKEHTMVQKFIISTLA